MVLPRDIQLQATCCFEDFEVGWGLSILRKYVLMSAAAKMLKNVCLQIISIDMNDLLV